MKSKTKNLFLSGLVAIAMVFAIALGFGLNGSQVQTAYATGGENSATYGCLNYGIWWDYDSSNHTLTITGTGDMPYLGNNDAWDDLRSEVKRIVIEDGITEIGQNSFTDFTALEWVIFPDTLHAVRAEAFMNCSSLKQIEFQEGLKAINSRAFMNCNSLESIVLPDTLEELGASSFEGCNVSSLYIGPRVDSLSATFFGSNPLTVYTPKFCISAGRLAKMSGITVKYDMPIEITYYPNGVKGKAHTAKILADSAYYLLENPYSQPEGVAFAGWSYGDSQQVYSERERVIFTENTKIKAVWDGSSSETCTIKYVADYFECDDYNPVFYTEEVNIGDVITIPRYGFAPSTAKYVCNAWIDVNSGYEYFPGQQLRVFTDLIIYADIGYYRGGTMGELFTVYYMEGERKFMMPHKIVGDTAVAPNTPSTSAGQEFFGWENLATGEIYDANQTIGKIKHNYYLRAIITNDWSTVSFDANGGIGTMTTKEIINGNVFTLPKNTFNAPDGKTFAYWTVNDVIVRTNKIVITEDCVIKPVWIGHKISFDANGGSGYMNTVKIKNDTYTLPECTFTPPENCEFYGWNLGLPGDTITLTDNIILQALWIPTHCKIKFSANGGSGTMGNVFVDYKQEYTLPECEFTAPEGMFFSNWVVNNYYALNPGDSVTIYSNSTIKAVWTNKFKVHYHFMGHGSSPEDVLTTTMTYESTDYSLTNTNDYRLFDYSEGSSYKFKWWSADENNLTDAYNFETPITAELNLYAYWVNECEVTYKGYYASGGSLTNTFEYGTQAYNETPQARSGYAFEGWYYNNSIYDFNSLLTKDIVLFARFTNLPTLEIIPSDDVFMRSTTIPVSAYVTGSYEGKQIVWSVDNEDAVSISKVSGREDRATLTVNNDAEFGAVFNIIATIEGKEYKKECMVSPYYAVILEDVGITESNRKDVFGDGLVSFNGENILTIRGGVYNGTESLPTLVSRIDGLIIEIEGNVTFIQNDYECIRVYGNTTITGNGTLTLISGKYNKGFYEVNSGAAIVLKSSKESYSLDIIDTNLIIARNFGFYDENTGSSRSAVNIKNSNIEFANDKSVIPDNGAKVYLKCASVTTPSNYSDKAIELGYNFYGFIDDEYNVIMSKFVITASGHSFSEWQNSKNPTRTASGTRKHYCEECGEWEYEEYSHTHTIKKVERETSCEYAGHKEYYICETCGAMFGDEAMNIEIWNEDDIVVSPLGHDWTEWIVTKPAKVGEAGIETRYCKNDNDHFETREIPALTESIKFVIHFTANGGINTMADVELLADEEGFATYVIPECEFNAPYGKAFACWQTDKYCWVGENMTVTENLNLVAVWIDAEKTSNNIDINDAKNGVDTTIFAEAKKTNSEVLLNIGEAKITFNSTAVNAIGADDMTYFKLEVVNATEDDIEGAQQVINISLFGFTAGTAIVEVPFNITVPNGKIPKVYFVDDDGNKTDMNATFENGKATFTTTHFSKYVIAFEDEAVAPTNNGGLSAGAIVAIIIASLAVLGGAGFCVYYFVIRKKKIAK